MSSYLHKANISSGFRQIKDGSQFDQFFSNPEEQDRIIIQDGEMEETVDLMKKVVWKYHQTLAVNVGIQLILILTAII